MVNGADTMYMLIRSAFSMDNANELITFLQGGAEYDSNNDETGEVAGLVWGTDLATKLGAKRAGVFAKWVFDNGSEGIDSLVDQYNEEYDLENPGEEEEEE